MAWQMMDVSALADLGVPWRESSFLFNPRLEVPRGKGTCGLKCIPLCALTFAWLALSVAGGASHQPHAHLGGSNAGEELVKSRCSG